MFGLATELITKGKLATVKRFDNKAFTHYPRNIVESLYNDY